MRLTEDVLNDVDQLELTYQWEHMERPDRVQVWYDETTDIYFVKFDGQPSSRFMYFGGVLVYLGDLGESGDWE